MAWAELLIFAGILLGLPGLVIIVSSALRKTSPRAGFVALGWTILIYIVTSLIASLVSQTSATNGISWLVGTIITAVIASRDGYRWGLSWLWFLLPGIGWWFLLWARNNQLDARRKGEGVVAPVAPSRVASDDPSLASSVGRWK